MAGKGSKPQIDVASRYRTSKDIIQKGKMMPLEVMIETMHFIWDESNQLQSEMEKPEVKGDPMQYKKMRALTKATKLEAAAIAKEAAPYLHARLAAITLGSDQENPLKLSLDSLILSAESLKSKIRVIDQPREINVTPTLNLEDPVKTKRE
jgi:hypothetical protein